MHYQVENIRIAITNKGSYKMYGSYGRNRNDSSQATRDHRDCMSTVENVGAAVGNMTTIGRKHSDLRFDA